MAVSGRREPRGPVAAMADSFAKLALEAKAERRLAKRGSWDDGEAAGRFNAYRNAAARAANMAGEPDPFAGEEG